MSITRLDHILLLVGTQTGNAERVADAVAIALEQAGGVVDVVDMWDAYPEMLLDASLLIICTSTWGDGELPDNAMDFTAALREVRPQLGGLGYGLIALGDHHYDPHFCAAAKILENDLNELGAARLVPTYEIDEGPSDADITGAQEWVRSLFLSPDIHPDQEGRSGES